ncbi:tyrosine-type recombinase/integrase [Pseudomonas putida]|uniref:tyrosine-type recombinase/integrase n=1 Tax=Pseudomonas putida TaxID=303 RepID=UPI001EE838CB|nr:site-specific integrase [Pseudomonas putida]
MKHVHLINFGIPRLYEVATSQPITAYNAYTEYLYNELYPDSGASTPGQYSADVARFFDYAYETGVLGGGNLTNEQAEATVRQYSKFLTEGVNSRDFLIKKAARALGTKPVVNASAARYVAAVNHFLHINNMQFKDSTLFAHLMHGAATENAPELSLLAPRRRKSTERKNISENTLQYGGTKSKFEYAHGGIPSPKISNKFEKRDFPTRHILTLLHSTSDPMQRCIQALQAGGGLRISEAFQMQLSDINRKSKTVLISDPDSLRDPPKKDIPLPFKGRQTAMIIMFEPYKSIFFDALEAYLQERPSTTTDYLFVSDEKETYGKTLVSTYPMNTLTKRYNRTLKKVQLDNNISEADGKIFTSHSLRHFYGNWARNCVLIPGRNRVGLELAEIQMLMGHKDIKSTERYAQLDDISVAAEIASANRLVHSWGSNYSADLVRGQVYARLADELMARAA